MTVTSDTPKTRQQGGPPLLAPVIAYGALMIAAVALSARVPQPSAAATAVLAYDQAHQAVMRVAGFLAFAAALPLAVWTAAVYRRLRTLGVTAPGAVIALSGGLLAASSLGLSGLLTWTSGQLGDANNVAVARALADLGFAAGSAGFVAPLGLLLAGVTVPALILRLMPRPLAWAGLVIAAVSLLSTFTLLTSALDPTLPVGRFAGLAWLIAASVTLPRDRRAAARNSRLPASSLAGPASPAGSLAGQPGHPE
jgi:hypothetical protein